MKSITPTEVQAHVLLHCKDLLALSANGNNGSQREFQMSMTGGIDVMRYVSISCGRKEAKLTATFYADVNPMSKDGYSMRRVFAPVKTLEHLTLILRDECQQSAGISDQEGFESRAYSLWS